MIEEKHEFNSKWNYDANGANDVTSYVYDALGRLDQITSSAGTFDYNYQGATSRIWQSAFSVSPMTSRARLNSRKQPKRCVGLINRNREIALCSLAICSVRVIE